MKITLHSREIEDLFAITPPEFPKYVTQIINLANQNAQGTRPAVVGQMTSLIQEFNGKNLDDWAGWYESRHPNAIETASTRIYAMLMNLKDAITKIDEDMVRNWVRDLVITKTFIGLCVQEAILKKVAQVSGKPYKLSTPEEEAKGIDGWIGELPVSIKPDTYDFKKALPETLQGVLIVYTKTKTGFSLDIRE